jgi:pimeloyl-ACP methyl ester carboxylesterase
VTAGAAVARRLPSQAMPETMARVGDVELCYETFGDAGDPALLLVMGLATQMLGWHEELCAALAGRGFHVIRFDNRDVGRSSALRQLPVPTLGQLLRRSRRAAAYSLDDMADDATGLLDHLEVGHAHVVGASMGGMIAQTVAVRHPERVLSLTSIMSNTGARWSGQPALRTYRTLLGRPPADRDEYVEHAVRTFEAIGSPGFPRDEEDLRRFARLSFDRGRNPAGAARQLAAIVASGDRTPLLRRIAVPTLVVHGTADRLVRPSGGRATARAIPGARLVEIEGMGHDLPRGAWPAIIDAIAANAARAGAARAAAA